MLYWMDDKILPYHVLSPKKLVLSFHFHHLYDSLPQIPLDPSLFLGGKFINISSLSPALKITRTITLISLSISLIIPLSQALAQEQQEQLLTYKDPTFGIEVRYPSLWEKIDFNTSKLEPMNVIVGFTVGKDNLTDEEANVFIVVEDSDNKFSTLKDKVVTSIIR
jgi:hypothetical protein